MELSSFPSRDHTWKIPIPAGLVSGEHVTVGLYLFIASWNEYLFALMLTGREIRPVTVALQMFIGENQVSWGLLMAGGAVVSIPATVFFLLAQKHLVGGLTGGAVKG